MDSHAIFAILKQPNPSSTISTGICKWQTLFTFWAGAR